MGSRAVGAKSQYHNARISEYLCRRYCSCQNPNPTANDRLRSRVYTAYSAGLFQLFIFQRPLFFKSVIQ